MVGLIEKEGAGYDFAGHRDAPAGLRIWCGATIEANDVALLTQWIDWAFAETKAQLSKRRSSLASVVPAKRSASRDP
jgi:phosphoserine aminotransferase